MSTQCIAVFGTASIQRYIFQSNRLKENIGASYLAKYWLDAGLIESTQADATVWNAYKDRLLENPPSIQEDADVSVIYIGGGNAALLCKNRLIAEEAVKNWSRKLLQQAPGLRVAVGYSEVTGSLAEAYNTALKNLDCCEEALPFGSVLYSLPIVRTCTTTGLPASTFSREDNNQSEWISQSAASKRAKVGTQNDPGDAQNDITTEFASVLNDEQRFSIELDDLGGSEGESHIAVVHADGNDLGKRLIEVVNNAEGDTDFLHHLRAFSASVSSLSRSALKETLQYFQNALPLEGLRSPKNVFPFRPIVHGGDDLTFVCDGRVGLHLTAYYLQEFAKGQIRVLGECQPVDACAGVAIVSTKFPFAQAYACADVLCGLAKAHRREKGSSSGSWLDFQIIQEGVTSSVATLRATQYRNLKGQILHQRPYEIPGGWKKFVEILQGFQSRQWPRSRAKGLLHALTQGPDATKHFVEGGRWRNIVLPDVSDIDENAKTTGWTGASDSEKTTPYFDPLEALDFYLKGILPTNNSNNEKADKE